MKLVALLLCVLLASCSLQNTPYAEVSLSLADAKPLEVDSPKDVVSYKYKATPLVKEGAHSENAFGTCDWTEVIVEQKKASLGYFEPGYWTIEVRGYNKYGAAIAQGQTEVYLRKGLGNAVVINLTYSGDGLLGESSLELSFSAVAQEEIQNEFVPHVYFTEVSWDGSVSTGVRQELDITWQRATNNNVIQYEGKGTKDMGQCAGILEVALLGPNDSYISSQSMLCAFVSGAVTKVTGYLEGGAYIPCSFVVTEDKTEIKGLIEVPKANKRDDNTFNAGVNEEVTLKFTSSDSRISSVIWYVDGVKKAEGTSVTLSFGTSLGQHEVTCTVFSEDKQKTAKATLLAFVDGSYWGLVEN